MAALAVVVAVVVATMGVSQGFYIPGTAPTEFSQGDVVELKAVKLTSNYVPLPYEYYFLPFCRPKKERHRSENLGEVLHGDRITNTPYILKVNVNESCQVLQCQGDDKPGRDYSKKEVFKLVRFIRQRYRASWLLDNLPAATRPVGLDTLMHGFPIGYVNSKTGVNLFNHVVFKVKIHEVTPERFRIVGFEVEPASIDASAYSFESDGSCTVAGTATSTPQLLDHKPLSATDNLRIVWTYSVRWEKSDIAWALRWDNYLKMANTEIHWYSIMNSLGTVIVLSGAVALILFRTLSNDIARYNEADENDLDDAEPTGWKMVAGDVFRSPEWVAWLCTFVGTGIQLLLAVVVTLVFACLGMLSPSSRGALMTEAILVFMLAGSFAGFHAGRLYRTLGGQAWKQVALQMALFFPGLVFGSGFLLNFFIWGKHSSGAVPFTTMLALLCMWFGISVPLVMGGFFFGFRKQAYSFPGSIALIARQVPPRKWYLQSHVATLIAGLLPFAAIYLELYFILGAIWGNNFYYLFGFLFIVFFVLIVLCSEMTIVLIYLQLCSEDYHWWWRSFMFSGSPAVFTLGYSVLYFFSSLSADEPTATLLYFGYSVVMCTGLFLMTGTIGFLASFLFIRKIYSAVKID